MKRFGLSIGGVEGPAAERGWFSSYDPATGEVLAEFARATKVDVRAAVEAARMAYADTWSHTSARERGRLLGVVAEAILDAEGELASWESRDCGKRLSLARQDMINAARYFEFFGNLAADLGGREIPVGRDVLDLTIREPFGVSAQINAWNFPLSMAARSIAAALAAGNTVVVKTSELAPVTTAMLGRMLSASGIPAGVVNILHGFGTECGAALAAHPGIDVLTFTGSVVTGIEVAKAAAGGVTPCVLELGGKSPVIVFPDADLDAAASALASALVDSNGQCCDLPSRALVHTSVHDEFTTRVVDTLASMTWGPGIDDHDWGPLISHEQLARVAGLVDRGCAAGATIAHGGRARSHPGGGAYFEPTVLVGVAPDLEIAHEEVFGPVLAVMPFDSEEEAVELANGTAYGLAAFVWTRDVARALRMTRDVRAGQVFVNCFGSGDPVMTPFGGFGRSGYGREKGAAALETYSQVKNICVSLA